MRILKNFCEIPHFVQVNSGVSCRLKCGKCAKKWGEGFVHRLETVTEKKGKIVPLILYICDNCLENIEANGLETSKPTCE